MEGIKVEVVGNVARVIDKPQRITAGTVGLPVEFSFDSQWEGLSKTAVFHAGHIKMIVDSIVDRAIVPWEVLAEPKARLSIGVYGVNRDGTVAIPTIWANVSVINVGATPDGDPSTEPTIPVYQKLLDDVGNLQGLNTKTKEDIVSAINEVYYTARTGNTEGAVTVRDIKLSESKWVGDASPYSQVVSIKGVTEFSKVDLQLSADQLTEFHDMDLSLTTENNEGVVTVFAIGDKPNNDITIQATLTEVIA